MTKLELVAATGCLLALGVLPPAWATDKCHKNPKTTQTQTDDTPKFFRFAANKKQAIKSGAINSNSHDNKPEKIPPDILSAIKKNPGLETGKGFRGPLNLESTDTDCQLFGLNVQLSNHPDTQQWLVTSLPPCGKYKHSQLNSPFWLVEQKNEESPKVLLAYRAYTLSALAEKHEEYADILISYQSLDGNDIDINWHYQGQGYTYNASMCSNLNPVNANEPSFFTDCSPVEGWSTQAESETGS